jgi:phosphinothricin acetyltransferase
MNIRVATPADAAAVTDIYAPIVRDSAISLECEVPAVDDMRSRIASTLQRLPWLVSVDGHGRIEGYAYAARHRDRAGYRWSVDLSAYVHEAQRGRGVGARLYRSLCAELAQLGYAQAFAGITLPNAASVAFHERAGFRLVGVYRQVAFKLGVWHDVGWWQRPLLGAAAPVPPAEPRAFEAPAAMSPRSRQRG